MTLELLHNTILWNVKSILEKGLIPAGAENVGQDWESYYHKTGVYFVPNNVEIPSRFCATLREMTEIVGDYLDGHNDDLGCIEVVIQVKLPFNIDTDMEKLVPDEETVNPELVTKGRGLYELLVNQDSVVWLGEVAPEHIDSIHIPNFPEVRDFLVKYEIPTDKIRLVDKRLIY